MHGKAPERIEGARKQGQPAREALCHSVDDQRSHFRWSQANPELLAQVRGPFVRAHAHQAGLGVGGPMPGAFVDQLVTDLFPDRLGVDEDPVQIEDHGVDHDRAIIASEGTVGSA
jgi:hypothetical protein